MMEYQLTSPYYLILLLLLPGFWAVSYFKYEYLPRLQFYLLNTLRSMIIILLVLALGGLRVPLRIFKDLAVVFVMDISDSIRDFDQTWMRDFMLRTVSAFKSEDRVGLITFAGTSNVELSPIIRNEAEKALKSKENLKDASGEFSSMFGGIQAGLSVLPTDTVRRIILLSDGNENLDDALKAAQSARDLGVRIYPVLLPERKYKEILIDSFHLPEKVNEGEAFRLKIAVLNTSDTITKGELKIFNDNVLVKKEPIKLAPGLNSYEPSYTISDPGTYQFTAVVDSEMDNDKRNNEMITSITVRGRSRILVIDGNGEKNSFLSKSLKFKDISVIVRGSGGVPKTTAELGEYDLLIFNNVSATEVSEKQMQMIKRYVGNFGGGLVMIGGENSFGSGGYAKTILEEVLPVNSEENISYKFKQALLYLVLDRSSSMKGRKIELAKKAALRVLNQLKDHDMLGVILFDSNFHEIIPLTMLYGNRKKIAGQINKISASKGGTNIYPALNRAYKNLGRPQKGFRDLPIQVKHIILLTDGKTYGGDFTGLAKAISKSRMTVSGIAIGYKADVKLLSQISKLGKGLFHHPSDLSKLPSVFSVDLENAISKAPFVERVFKPKKKGEGRMIKGIKDFPPLKGYMVTSVKPETDVLLESTTRGISDPILATWRYGLGKSTAYTSDVDARWSVKWIKWDEFSKFWSQVARYTMRQKFPVSYQLSSKRTPDGAIIIAENRGKKSPTGELSAGLVGPDGKAQEVVFKKTSPGRYEARIKIGQFGKYLISIREKRDKKIKNFSTQGLVISPSLPEYRKLTINQELLKKIAIITGGIYNPATSAEIASYQDEIMEPQDVWYYLTVVALILFLADVAIRRLWL
jgi:uncharacterized membrane protein/secreted protein with Ig-like and vWFA domain